MYKYYTDIDQMHNSPCKACYLGIGTGIGYYLG